MNDGAIHQMSAAIGGLQADVKNLKDSIDNLNQIWGLREESATAGRRVVHEKVDLLRKDFTHLSAEVENVSMKLTEIEPAISEFKDARQRLIGARHLGKFLWGAFLSAAGAMGYALGEWLHLFWPPKGH